MDPLYYKGYIGTVNYSEKDGVYFGKIEGIDGLVNYEGKNLDELVNAFHQAVEGYIVTARGRSAFARMRKCAAQQGLQDMSLDEINEIINEVRSEDKATSLNLDY